MASVKPSFRGAVVERIVTRKKRYSIVLSVFRGDGSTAIDFDCKRSWVEYETAKYKCEELIQLLNAAAEDATR